jgi:SNF2 family DNA or RNA helicase
MARLTTYHEVYSSYPRHDYPEDKKDPAEKQEWWLSHFEKNKGPLHQMHFHRLVVDECQQIKNPRGEFYESVKALQATHRWLLSGTPIVDKTSEIYAYYRIIHKAYTGDLRTFRANFLNKRDRNAQEKINFSMNNFILRRTADDVLNGQQLLHIPRARETRLSCDMTAFEKAVYIAVLDKFEVLIAQAKDKEEPIFSLILR